MLLHWALMWLLWLMESVAGLSQASTQQSFLRNFARTLMSSLVAKLTSTLKHRRLCWLKQFPRTERQAVLHVLLLHWTRISQWCIHATWVTQAIYYYANQGWIWSVYSGLKSKPTVLTSHSRLVQAVTIPLRATRTCMSLRIRILLFWRQTDCLITCLILRLLSWWGHSSETEMTSSTQLLLQKWSLRRLRSTLIIRHISRPSARLQENIFMIIAAANPMT